MKKIIYMIGVLLAGIVLYLFLMTQKEVPVSASNTQNQSENSHKYAGGEWEVTRAVHGGETQTGKNCISQEALSEFYSSAYFLKDLERNCETDIVNRMDGYEITGKCINNSARYTTRVTHKHLSDTHFTLAIEVRNKDNQLSYAESLEAKRIQDCESTGQE